MKRLAFLTAIAAIALSAPAMAGHHKGGKFFERDTDGDGAVSKSEYLKAAEDKFMTLDKDGNGSVSKDEYKAHRKAWKKDHKKHGKDHDHGDHEHADHHDENGDHDQKH